MKVENKKEKKLNQSTKQQKYQKSNNKLQQGITLIALVITIIVLLILAGVSIATLTGDNGILEKANKAKDETTVTQEKELIQLAFTAALSKKEANGSVTAEDMEKELNNLGAEVTVNGEIDIIFNNTKHMYLINQSGENITGPLDNLPIDIEEAIEQEFTTKTYVRTEDKKIVPIPANFKIASDSATKVEDGVVIEDTRAETAGSQFVWIPVTDGNKYVRNTTYTNVNISAKSYDDEGYLPEEITSEKQAVLKAGGFYVSRFEAGQEDGNTLVSKKDATVWSNVTQEDCKVEAKKFINNNGIKSALISGIQWDIVMKFVDKKLDGNNEMFDVTIVNKGRHTESLAKSGQNEADKVCNIYDLESNCFEYVAEKNDYDTNYPCVIRGGYYGTKLNYPASYRNYSFGRGIRNYSFRFVLYVL